MNPRDMSPERDAYSTRVLTLTCMSDFLGILRLWMSAVFEGIADGHDLRSPSERVMDELERLFFLMDYIEIPFASQQAGGYNTRYKAWLSFYL